MKKRISIGHLTVGMFLEANVHSIIADDGEVRHFLRPHGAGAPAPGDKRVRMFKGKHLEVADEGGLFIASEAYLDVLRKTGLDSVVINTLKGVDLPGHLQPLLDPPTPTEPDAGTRAGQPHREDRILQEGTPAKAEASVEVIPGIDVEGDDTDAHALDGRIEFKFPDGAEQGLNLKAAFAATSLEALLEKETPARLVAPGEELAVRVPPQVGKLVTDASGNRSRQVGKEARLDAGPHVRAVGNRYVSEIYGYVCVLGEEIQVIPPIWISPDRVEAHFVHFSQTGPVPPPKRDWVMRLLQFLGVRHGILEAAIQDLCNRPFGGTERASMPLARGERPVPGVDARVEFAFDPEGRKTCGYLPDGSVDLDAWRRAVGVQSGGLLAKVFPATPARPGMDLEGREIPAKAGEPLTLQAGENVRVDDQDGAFHAFYAATAGNAEVEQGTIHVRPVFVVNGSAGDAGGNIDVDGNVEICGSVVAGTSVRAAGSIVIRDTVHPGATITARGDVIVSKGIVGETTRVFARGSVHTRFIQGGSVMALGDITVGSHIFKAYVRTGGRVIVRAGDGERGGSIVGGQTYAGTCLEAASAGSEAGIPTQIGILPAPEAEGQLQKLNQGIGVCKTNILRILRTLGLRDVEAANLHHIIQRMPLSHQIPVKEMLEKLKHWVGAKEKSLAKWRKLHRECEIKLQRAEVRITGKIYSDVRVRLGDKTMTVTEELDHARFSRISGNGSISCQPLK
ncbi:MAG: DUF342 domain-containing protein [Candidatus Latescibacteria bacterium]|nr:DUF342 domain-containing protein [Candidatus Latescibacterota bacterium]